jgi:hypothetical protein
MGAIGIAQQQAFAVDYDALHLRRLEFVGGSNRNKLIHH